MTARTLVQRWGTGSALAVPVVAAVAVTTAGLFWAIGRTSYDVWGGMVVALVLLAVHIPLLRWATRRETDPLLRRIVYAAFTLKLGASVARYVVVFALYDGSGDAGVYHDAALDLYPAYRSGDLGAPISGLPGSRFIIRVTGLVYALTGPTKVGGFLVFATLGFWGAFLFYRAFALACPEGSQRRYALLVLLLPSILFWPASIGKEAWMTLGLGLGAYGAARMLTHRRGGIVCLLLGALAANAVRPHVAGLLVVSAGAAYLLRRRPGNASLLAPLAKAAGVVAMAVALVIVFNSAEDVLGFDSFNREAVRQTLARAERQTSTGGSAFDAGIESTDFSPSEFPSALMSVMFRPFPWEAENAQAFIAALEGQLLLVLFVLSWRRLLGAVRSLLRTPYVVLCTLYSLLFVYGFSSFSNFGVLTRQRVQLLPFVLVVVCLPPFRAREQGGWRGLLIDAQAPATAGAERPPTIAVSTRSGR